MPLTSLCTLGVIDSTNYLTIRAATERENWPNLGTVDGGRWSPFAPGLPNSTIQAGN